MTRLDCIMSKIDAWADENEVANLRADVEYCIQHLLEHCSNMTDDELVEEGIAMWLEAE